MHAGSAILQEIQGNTHMRTNDIVKWVISDHGTDGSNFLSSH